MSGALIAVVVLVVVLVVLELIVVALRRRRSGGVLMSTSPDHRDVPSTAEVTRDGGPDAWSRSDRSSDCLRVDGRRSGRDQGRRVRWSAWLDHRLHTEEAWISRTTIEDCSPDVGSGVGGDARSDGGSELIVPDSYEQRIRTDLTGFASELAVIEGERP